MWESVKEKISSLPEFDKLVLGLSAEGARVRAGGLSGSSRSMVLAALREKDRRPMILVASDPVRARDIMADLETFGVERAVLYPEDEILPYDYHDPDRNLTGLQMKALDALSGGSADILVCTVRSMMKKVMPPEVLRSHMIDLVLGSDGDPSELAGMLVSLGYERHSIVEAKGQFAVRGGIVDIFEVAADEPVRIEFDGDEISSVRDFDIETQRSTGRREGLRVRPFHHLIPNADGIGRLRAFLAEGAEELSEEDRARRMSPADRLENGILFFGMEHYSAVIHDVVPVYSYFSEPPLTVFYDAEDTESVAGEFREEIGRRFERSKEEGHYYPEPARIYISEDELDQFLSSAGVLDLVNLASPGALRFGTRGPSDYRRNIKGLAADIQKEVRKGNQVFLFCSNRAQRERSEEVLSDVALDMDFPEGYISGGFGWPDAGIVFLSEDEVFGRYHRPWSASRARSRSLAYDPSHFQPGDFVVHVSHGIGRYMGMRVLEIEGGRTECLDIRYEGKDRLFIPVTQLRLVEKYTASDGAAPVLAALGSRAWKRAKEKARKSAGRIARDLLEIYAARELAEGHAFGRDKPWQKEMEASFPWEETPHQLQATAEVKSDLESARPMDRLLCGDVGFGKTEVAVRAAFKVVLEGKQAVFLVPTTVLALQHYNTLRDRLAGFPVSIAMLSRFVPAARQKKTVEQIAAGKVDIVVGTHRLISKDVSFSNLGLVVVDEEHRFGVGHKETFKKIKKNVDVLSMTATPIPRTLSMAISGIRDISVIDTPPRNRLPIHTEILPFDDGMIREAVMREVQRGGQVFFVHNRVQSIGVMEGYLRRLLPEKIRIAHAHGQMHERELEKIMIEFLNGSYDVLLCTMIIEAGLDFPNVNTIIINRADRFGLAQLYQLRGRVGRSDRKAYAYMLVPKGRALSGTALKRLQAITEFDYLGAGYRIAMRDLEIRGAGNLLGHQQSGQINAVGLDMYSRMIKEEVARIRGEQAEEERDAKVSIPVPAYLPEAYISDSEERMDIYRRLAGTRSPQEAEDMAEELRDRFGAVPAPAGNMLRLVSAKVRAARAGIASVEAKPGGALRIDFAQDRVPGKGLLVKIAAEFAGRITFHTGQGIAITLRPPSRPGTDFAPGRGAPGGLTAANETGERHAWAFSDLESLLNLLEFSDI